MAEARQNTIVGLFALVGIGVMVGLVFAFGGGRTLFASTYDVSVHFEKGVVGVQEGQSVTLYGKRIGETKKVVFWTDETGTERPEQGVNVILAVEADYELPASSKVVVATSIMGFGRPAIGIVIEDPLDPTKLPRDGTAVIMGEMVEILDQLLPPHMQQTLVGATKSLDELATALTPVAENLARLLEERDMKKVDLGELTANLDIVIQRFDATLRNFNALIGDEQNVGNLGILLANLREMSDAGIVLAENLVVMSEDGKQVIKDGGVMIRKLASALDNVSALVTQLDRTAAMLNDGDGTAALFLRDNRLYEELVLTVKRLSKLADEFREVVKDGKLRIKSW